MIFEKKRITNPESLDHQAPDSATASPKPRFRDKADSTKAGAQRTQLNGDPGQRRQPSSNMNQEDADWPKTKSELLKTISVKDFQWPLPKEVYMTIAVATLKELVKAEPSRFADVDEAMRCVEANPPQPPENGGPAMWHCLDVIGGGLGVISLIAFGQSIEDGQKERRKT